MKVLFMGTPEFAVPSLNALLLKHEVVAVVTQPDKPKGRGNKVQFSEVKQFCVENNIEVLQPKRVKSKKFILELRKYDADIFVVAAYGQMLSEEILNMPKYGCINVHGSLLPKYRGAAPIHWAIVNGEDKTGITIMKMDKGLDTGDIILKRELDILQDDTVGSLHDKMSILGSEALIEAIEQIENKTAVFEKQNDELHTYAPMLEKETGLIDWNTTSTEIANKIRGLNPWPTAYSYYMGNIIKIWSAKKCDAVYNGSFGEIVDFQKDGFVVKTGDGCVKVTEIQVQGGRRMSVADYVRGHEIKQNVVLGL